MKQEPTNTGVFDVLSGNKAAKIDVAFDTTSVIILGVTILVAVALGVIISKKVV